MPALSRVCGYRRLPGFLELAGSGSGLVWWVVARLQQRQRG